MKKLLLTLLCICSTAILAQDRDDLSSNTKENPRTFLIEPYLMLPNMKGTNQIRNLPPVEVDANTGDIFGQLKFGGMLYFETTKNNWTLGSDLIYMHLAMGLEEGIIIDNGELTLKELLFEVSALRKIQPWLEVGIGGRVVSIKEELTINKKIGNPMLVSAGLTETWFDPVIIARSNGAFNEKWFYELRGDLGGFGIGSDFTWQIQANVGYRFSEKFHLSLGYRNIDIDYESGSGTEYFKYDMSTFGPNIRAGWSL